MGAHRGARWVSRHRLLASVVGALLVVLLAPGVAQADAPPFMVDTLSATQMPLDGTTTLTYTIFNPNPDDATGVGFIDVLTPVGIQAGNVLTNTCGGAVGGSTTVIVFVGGTISPGGACTISLQIAATAPGTYFDNNLGASSLGGGAGPAPAPFFLNVVAPPSIVEAFGASAIPKNGTTSLTFTFFNPSGTVSLTGLGLTDSLPSGLVVATPNGLTDGCGGVVTAVAGSGSISLAGGALAPTASCMVTVNVTGTAGGSFTNTTDPVTSTEGGTGNTASAPLTVVAPPSIAASFNPAEVPLNGTSTLTVTITNPAENTVAENGVAFSGLLPVGMVVATPNGLTDNCGGTVTAIAGSSTISLTGGSVAIASSCTIDLNVTVGGFVAQFTDAAGPVSSTNGGTGNTALANLAAKASPTQSASAPATGTAGSAISPSAVSGMLSGGFSPTGTVTFKVFGPQPTPPTDCSGGTTVGTATASGDGPYGPASGFTPPAAGDYWWFASYGGDTNNFAADSGCGSGMTETVVGPASPSLGSVSAPASGTAGSAIAPSAVSGVLSGGASPTGTVTFKVFGPQPSAPTDCSGGTTVGTAGVSGNGPYGPSAGFSPASAGDYWWFASYGGDASNNSAASTCGAGMAETVVGAASPSLSVGAPAGGTLGSTISPAALSAGLSGGSIPSGMVTFKVFGPQSSPPSDCSAGTAVGTATVSGNGTYHPSAGFTPGSPGDYWWFASYGGDANNNAANSTCGAAMTETVVGLASPAVGSVGAPGSAVTGSLISASAVSAGLSGGDSPTGTVTFKVFGPQPSAPSDCSGGTTVGTASASGDGTYNPSAGFTPTSPGDYWWFVSYGGDSNNNAAHSACGSAMTETVVGLASPSVSVSAPSSGKAGSTISPSAGLSGGALPSGTVTFKVFGPQPTAPSYCSGGTTVGTASASGDGTYSPSSKFTPAQAGDYWWFASYSGDFANNGANSACGSGMTETVVGRASPVMSLKAPAAGTAESAISASALSARLSAGSAPTGAVTFKVFGPHSSPPSHCSGGTTVGTASALGNGTYHPSSAFTPTTPGDYWWYASYAGDTSNKPAASRCGTSMAETVVISPLRVGRVSVSGPTAQVPITCRTGARNGCPVELTLETTNAADTLHVVTVGRTSAMIATGQTRTIDITLNDNGQTLLAKRQSLETTLTVVESGQLLAHKIVTFR